MGEAGHATRERLRIIETELEGDRRAERPSLTFHQRTEEPVVEDILVRKHRSEFHRFPGRGPTQDGCTGLCHHVLVPNPIYFDVRDSRTRVGHRNPRDVIERAGPGRS